MLFVFLLLALTSGKLVKSGLILIEEKALRSEIELMILIVGVG
jgi:hypothetical protein